MLLPLVADGLCFLALTAEEMGAYLPEADEKIHYYIDEGDDFQAPGRAALHAVRRLLDCYCLEESKLPEGVRALMGELRTLIRMALETAAEASFYSYRDKGRYHQLGEYDECWAVLRRAARSILEAVGVEVGIPKTEFAGLIRAAHISEVRIERIEIPSPAIEIELTPVERIKEVLRVLALPAMDIKSYLPAKDAELYYVQRDELNETIYPEGALLRSAHDLLDAVLVDGESPPAPFDGETLLAEIFELLKLVLDEFEKGVYGFYWRGYMAVEPGGMLVRRLANDALRAAGLEAKMPLMGFEEFVMLGGFERERVVRHE